LLSNLNRDVQLLVVQPDRYEFLQHASDPIMPALEHFFDDDEDEVKSSEEDTSSESSEVGESSDFSEEVDTVDKKPNQLRRQGNTVSRHAKLCRRRRQMRTLGQLTLSAALEVTAPHERTGERG
jgi:hypothetical protein